MPPPASSEADAIADIGAAGFSVEAKDYPAGTSAPHSHDYDVCLQVVEGAFQLNLVEDGTVQSCGPGDRVYVPAGTLHFESHGPVRVVIGRREP